MGEDVPKLIIKCIVAGIVGIALGYGFHTLGFSYDLQVYVFLGTLIGVLFALYEFWKKNQDAGKRGEKGGEQKESGSPSGAGKSQTKRPNNSRTRGKRVKPNKTQKLGILGLFLICLFCIVMMALLDGRQTPPVEDTPNPEETENPGETENPAGEDIQTKDPPQKEQDEPKTAPEEAPAPTPSVSETQWVSDPYLLNLDEYYHSPVPEEEKGEVISLLLTSYLEDIKVRGPFPADDLNGARSEYARHTADANEYEDGRDRLASGKSILPEYQREFNEKAAAAREAADKLYEVCDNEMCLGNLYLMLGNSYQQEDTNKAMEYYDAAFQIFEKAYRTGIAEGVISPNPLNNSPIKKELTSNITDTSKKINNLKMYTPEQDNARLVAAVFEDLLPTDAD